jgi:hypothetical protein
MDSLDVVFEKFFQTRNRNLWERFKGTYRSIVVETNDPLQMGRVRFRCPDLHDWNLPPADCPWAVPAPEFGGQKAGRWVSPCIGDYIWITFERGHPYGPVWIGYSSPTRRKLYPLPSIAGQTPLPVNEFGQPAEQPDDVNTDYMPLDGRPMSLGTQDRYGHLDIMSAVGFFPVEHTASPPSPDFDAITTSEFQSAASPPQPNQPDVKYMGRITKYGHMHLMADMGYAWQKNGETGEFYGDVAKDEQFDITRWKLLQQLICEGQPSGRDQRRQEWRTRYGHRGEMRDVGWAQPGPKSSKTRQGEWGDPVFLSTETTRDERWIKWRTKAGMLWQLMDMGADPQDDDFIQRLLSDEVGNTDKEEVWQGKDARMIRAVTRHGIKFVLDDRGTDPRSAQDKENPRPNGFMLKGRRTGGAAGKEVEGQPVGFYIEANENDESNHLTIGSPLGTTLEINDYLEYAILCTGLGKGYPMPWKGLEENEFLRNPVMLGPNGPAHNCSHHLLLDHENEMIRLKSRAGLGEAPDNVVNQNETGLQQGIEAHDGQSGDGAWLELVDIEHRGFWFSKNKKLGVWRAAEGTNMMAFMDEDKKTFVILNHDGKIQIYSKENIEFKSDKDILFDAGGTIAMKAQEIKQSTKPKSGGDTLEAPKIPDQIEPTDRGTTYNQAVACPDDEIEHLLQ